MELNLIQTCESTTRSLMTLIHVYSAFRPFGVLFFSSKPVYKSERMRSITCTQTRWLLVGCKKIYKSKSNDQVASY